nr:disulfide isomerase DsbC N-terminal domain-containing protein [uncultured Halomonas sp.]
MPQHHSVARACTLALAITATSGIATANDDARLFSGTEAFISSDSKPDLVELIGNIEIDALYELPTDGMTAMIVDDEVFFTSKDGRFLFQGRAHDLWYNHSLDNEAAIAKSTQVLRLQQMGIDSRQLSGIVVGGKTATASLSTVFIDPLCDNCLNYVQQVLDADMATAPVAFVVIPVLGEASEAAALQFACRDDSVTDSEALAALLGKDLASLPGDPPESCNADRLHASLLLAQTLQVNGVPFTAGANGDVVRGIPADLTDMLREYADIPASESPF